MLLAGVLARSEEWEMIEICERTRIARWHDAASIAKAADPSALFITSPLQSHRVSDALFHPLRCPVTNYQNHDIARPVCPAACVGRCPSSSRATAFGPRPKRVGPHPVDETSEGEECVCREKVRAREKNSTALTTPQAILSPRV